MIEYTGEKISLKIEPRSETGGDYFFRTGLLAKIAEIKEIPEWDELTYFFYFPLCISCTTGEYTIGDKTRNIREMSVTEFIDIVPGQVMRIWADKVLELNQHLLEFEPADNKKK